MPQPGHLDGRRDLPDRPGRCTDASATSTSRSACSCPVACIPVNPRAWRRRTLWGKYRACGLRHRMAARRLRPPAIRPTLRSSRATGDRCRSPACRVLPAAAPAVFRGRRQRDRQAPRLLARRRFAARCHLVARRAASASRQRAPRRLSGLSAVDRCVAAAPMVGPSDSRGRSTDQRLPCGPRRGSFGMGSSPGGVWGRGAWVGGGYVELHHRALHLAGQQQVERPSDCSITWSIASLDARGGASARSS